MAGQLKAEAKWGFLKNIVNIDTFFSNSGAKGGAHKKAVKKPSLAQKTMALA